MNRKQRWLSRKARAKVIAKQTHWDTVGTKDRAPTLIIENGCGPGFPKNKAKNGKTGRRKNPLPGPGSKNPYIVVK